MAAAVVVLALLAPPALAQNPLMRGKSAEAEAARVVVEPPGLVQRVWQGVRDIQGDVQRRIGRHMRIIAQGESSMALLIGMGLAFLYGVFHTIGPGHGKTVVASYFLAHDSRFSRGVLMGAKIAVTHVVSAVVLVVVADVTLRQALGGEPTEVRWVQAASYGSIAAIGLYLMFRAVRHLRGGARDHHHHHGTSPSGAADRRQQTVLSIAAGLVPCTGALLVMLYALANGIVMSGVALVVSISLGMAVTVAVIGLVCIFARQAVMGWVGLESRGGYRLGVALEFAGAAAITGVGALFFAAALPTI